MMKLLKTAVFLAMMSCMAFLMNHLTLNRTSEGCIQLTDFYQLQEDHTDVLCLGSSHVYYGINTCLLYDDYGIAGYLLASPGQPVWISYYLLEEALKTQNPGLVIFDVGTLFQKEDDFGSSSWETLISMKPSYTKWNALKAVNRYGECLDTASAFFSFPYYHMRSLSLSEQDYRNTELIRYHGYKPEFGVISAQELAKWEKKKVPDSDAAAPVTERTKEFLLKIIYLCSQNDISLVLVNSPFANLTLEKLETGNYIRLLAEEHGIPFLEGNRLTDEMQICFQDDLLDASHLNYYGSVKYTDYLAKWLKKNYDIPDRRGDSRYQEWEAASRLFYKREGENLNQP